MAILCPTPCPHIGWPPFNRSHFAHTHNRQHTSSLCGSENSWCYTIITTVKYYGETIIAVLTRVRNNRSVCVCISVCALWAEAGSPASALLWLSRRADYSNIIVLNDSQAENQKYTHTRIVRQKKVDWENRTWCIVYYTHTGRYGDRYRTGRQTHTHHLCHT